MDLWIKIGIVVVCVGTVLRGFILEIVKIRKRNTCLHMNKTLVLRYYPDMYDQYHCTDCGNDVFEDIKNDT